MHRPVFQGCFVIQNPSILRYTQLFNKNVQYSHMKKVGTLFGLSALALAPALALAQFGEINDFLGDISSFINGTLIPLLFALALLLFLWGVFSYFILGKTDETKREDGKQYMLWAVIGFVIMVSIFGVVNLIAGGLGFSDDEEIENIPNVPTSNR